MIQYLHRKNHRELEDFKKKLDLECSRSPERRDLSRDNSWISEAKVMSNPFHKQHRKLKLIERVTEEVKADEKHGALREPVLRSVSRERLKQARMSINVDLSKYLNMPKHLKVPSTQLPTKQQGSSTRTSSQVKL